MKVFNTIIATVAPLILIAYSNNIALPEPNRELDKNIILSLVNEYRTTGADCGDEYHPPVDPLKWNNKLQSAAQAHSNDMHANEFMSHTGSDGSSPGDRLIRVDYHWSTYGENVAMGEILTEETVVDGWMASPGHCKIIMNASFEEMAVARSDMYWTQVFAREIDRQNR